MSVTEAAVLILFPLLMAYAALSDLFTMTISNVISILLVVGFAVLALASGMPAMTLLGSHLAAGVLVLAITFVFFARGWIGGGDAKLAAGTAVWLGWGHLLDYGLQASILGAVLTIGLVYARRFALPDALATREWIARLHQRGNGVPYGIALAIAGLVTYPETPLWRTVVG